VGELDATDVRRGMASLGVTAGAGGMRLRLSAAAGQTTLEPDSAPRAVAFESFTLGGLEPPLFDETILPQRISVPALPANSATGRAFVSYRASLAQGGLPASLYAAWFKLYDPNGRWLRLLGMEGEQIFPAIGFAGLPNVTLSYGVAYSVDHPRRHRWTLYAGARYAP
jgi:hypothetical protein